VSSVRFRSTPPPLFQLPGKNASEIEAMLNVFLPLSQTPPKQGRPGQFLRGDFYVRYSIDDRLRASLL